MVSHSFSKLSPNLTFGTWIIFFIANRSGSDSLYFSNCLSESSISRSLIDGSENQPEFRGKLLNQNSTVGILNYVSDASE